MPRRLPPLNALRAFEASARLASFSAAAAELAVTPAAVSRQIKILEVHLGVRLFDRLHRRVLPTAAGTAYLVDVREALDRLAAATERVRSPERRRALAICSSPAFAIRWLVPRWGRFHDRHPDIDVQLTTSLAAVDLDRGDFDALVRVGPGRDPSLDGFELVEILQSPVCSPALLERGPPLATPDDLVHHTLLHSAPRPDDWGRWLAAAGAGAVDATSGHRFESLNLAFQAAIEGIGLAIGIEALVADDLAAGRLVLPFAIVRRSGRPFHLVWPRRKAEDGRLRAFVDWIAGEAATERAAAGTFRREPAFSPAASR